MAKTDIDEKRYYSISEVARMTGLEPYVLRFWEKEFPTLRPRKNRGGNRMYTRRDIELVNRINYLRNKEGLTIAGARSRLSLRRPAEKESKTARSARIRTIIGQMRKDIEDLLKSLS